MDIQEVQRGKRRGWIKNAAIIFLAVLLLLTFFSQTIMNHSLPEVATQYVTSGSISAKIRGTGTVTANATYEVKLRENRLVKTVAVRRGDTVEAGALLLILDEGESADTTELRKQLEEARYSYRAMLLDYPYVSTAKDTLELQRLRGDLSDAIEERDLGYVSDEQLESARGMVADREIEAKVIADGIRNIEDEIQAIDDRIAEVQEQIAELGGGGGEGGASGGDFADLAEALNNADIERRTEYLMYREAVLDLYRTAAQPTDARYDQVNAQYYFYNFLTNDEIAQMQAWAREASGDPVFTEREEVKEDGTVEVVTDVSYDDTVEKALKAIQAAEAAFADAYQAMADAQAEYAGVIIDGIQNAQIASQVDALKAQLKELQAQKKEVESTQRIAEHDKEDADAALADAKALVQELQERKAGYKALEKAVKAAEQAIEDYTIGMQTSQHDNSVNRQKYDLELEKLKQNVEELEKKLEGEDEEERQDTVTSPVAGVIKEINISAGSTTEYDVTLMTIEEQDRGYMLSFAVTTEQAQRVKIGDQAEPSGYYWGPSYTATLVAITNDPANPGRGKLLNFSIDGEVSAGDQLSIALGERGQNYELTVPNSAVRSDTNGSYVLTVTAKNSPLGDRYVATRVDVQVLASDDTMTAVSGPLVSYDYVITTSSAPLKPGQYVRLASN